MDIFRDSSLTEQDVMDAFHRAGQEMDKWEGTWTSRPPMLYYFALEIEKALSRVDEYFLKYVSTEWLEEE